jgi:WhiB family redox-sensing transcriptional regulator
MHTGTSNAALDIGEAEARIAWVSQARCRGVDPDQLFVRGAAHEQLDNRVEFGVWGGMTERQRRALIKQHPEVDSWSEFFETQRHHQSAV